MWAVSVVVCVCSLLALTGPVSLASQVSQTDADDQGVMQKGGVNVEVYLSLLNIVPEDIINSNSIQFVFQLVVASLAETDVAPSDVYFLDAYNQTFSSILAAAPMNYSGECVPEVHTYQSTTTHFDNSTGTNVTEPYTFEVVTGTLTPNVDTMNVTVAKFLIANVPEQERQYNISMRLIECPKMHYAILQALLHRGWSDDNSVLLEFLTFDFSNLARPASSPGPSPSSGVRQIPNNVNEHMSHKKQATSGALVGSVVVLGALGMAAVTFSVRRVLVTQKQDAEDTSNLENQGFQHDDDLDFDPSKRSQRDSRASDMVYDTDIGNTHHKTNDDEELGLGDDDDVIQHTAPSAGSAASRVRATFASKATGTKQFTRFEDQHQDDHDHDDDDDDDKQNTDASNDRANLKAVISGVIDDAFFQSDDDSSGHDNNTDSNSKDTGRTRLLPADQMKADN